MAAGKWKKTEVMRGIWPKAGNGRGNSECLTERKRKGLDTLRPG